MTSILFFFQLKSVGLDRFKKNLPISLKYQEPRTKALVCAKMYMRPILRVGSWGFVSRDGYIHKHAGLLGDSYKTKTLVANGARFMAGLRMVPRASSEKLIEMTTYTVKKH